VRWENTGDISEKHLSQLLAAAESAPLPDAPKGRPIKTWRRFNPGRHWQGYRYVKNGDNYRGDGARPKQWLWRPGHPEHGLSLDSYPTGVGDSWTEETEQYGTTRIRYAIDDAGCHYQVEIMEDYFTKLAESGFKDKDITLS
jgi:hypothetical protein